MYSSILCSYTSIHLEFVVALFMIYDFAVGLVTIYIYVFLTNLHLCIFNKFIGLKYIC